LLAYPFVIGGHTIKFSVYFLFGRPPAVTANLALDAPGTDVHLRFFVVAFITRLAVEVVIVILI